MNTQGSTKPDSAKAYRWLMGALFIWTVVLATGTVLFGYRTDYRKPLIVVATMSLFLFVWIGLIALRRRRIERA